MKEDERRSRRRRGRRKRGGAYVVTEVGDVCHDGELINIGGDEILRLQDRRDAEVLLCCLCTRAGVV